MLATRRSINVLINTRESKRVSQTSFVQIGVIHTHAPGAIFLEHKHMISQPLIVKNFDDEPGSQKLGHFFCNSFMPLLIKTTEELSDMFHLRIHIKVVLSEFSQYTQHIRRLPCKDVLILTDELDDCAFLFGIHPCPNGELL